MKAGVAGILMALAGVGCAGSGSSGTSSSSSSGGACVATSSYVPFSNDAGATQREMVDAHAQMDGVFHTGTLDRAAFATARPMYTQHIGPTLGAADAALHARIQDAFDRAANTADTTDLSELKQVVDKSVIRFLYSQVVSRVAVQGSGTQAAWDEAWGAFGGTVDGTATHGVAEAVDEYDTFFGTDFISPIKASFVTVRCAADVSAAGNVEGPKVAAALRTSFAYAAAKYFQKASLGTGTREDITEGSAYFYALEPWLQANGHSDDAAIIHTWLSGLLYPATAMPDTAGANQALNILRTTFQLNI